MITKEPSTIPYRPLGHIMSVVETLGLEVTYSYDDLVFVEHNAFLFRMGERGEDVYLHLNVESDDLERTPLSQKIIAAGKQQGLNIQVASLYSMNQKNDEQMELSFDC